MTGRRPYVVACLAGHGVGPEVMAGASRALAEVSRQHGFAVEQVHPPFAGEAMTQTGHPLPAATRNATLGADAILAAGATEPALEDVKAELDLAARMVRIVLDDGRDLTLLAPLHESVEEWTIERAFLTARARSGRIASVAVSPWWRERVARHAARHDGVTVTDVSLADALHALAQDPAVQGILLVERTLADAVVAAPRLGGRRYLSATGYLSASGPGLFTPHHEHPAEAAGQGVADPSEAILAAALLLGEGLGRRSAAEALDESLAAALSAPRRTPDLGGGGVSVTTREFVDAVLGLLPSARRDTDFALGVGRW
jgi:3-isopropylmalate dehydrogenase